MEIRRALSIAVQGVGFGYSHMALQGFACDSETVDQPDDTDAAVSPFTPARRAWRPLPIDPLPPAKRKRKRRQADILFLGH